MTNWIGQSVARPEDDGLLRGDAKFIAEFDDRLLADCLVVVFVRSTVAHGHLISIDADEARRAPGVHAVVTAFDHDVIPAGSVSPDWYPPMFAMPLLAEKKVRYVGEPVAAVVAQSTAFAVDAAELVTVDIDPLPAVIDVNDAMRDHVLLFTEADASRVQDGAIAHGRATELPMPSNIVMRHEVPHDEAPFAAADVVIRERFWNPRQSPAPIETLGQACAWSDGHLHIWSNTQRPHGFRDQLVAHYRLPEDHIHITAPPAVGGAFGGKVSRTPEEHALPMLAAHVGQPVRWHQTRSEYFVSATQGRGEQIDFTLAGNRDGRVVALHSFLLKDAGAYPAVGGNLPARFNSLGEGGPYDIAHVEFTAMSVVTNAPQTSAFRGAGRGPYLAALERMMDLFARELDMDPTEVRRINLVPPEAMPFTNTAGRILDEADYPGDLQRALDAADYIGLRAEQQARRDANATRQLGIGIATFHLMTVGGGGEEARVTINADGTATVFTGTTSQGHGHTATWAQIVASILHIDVANITVLQGSTHFTPTGVGAIGSRSMQTAGVAIHTSSTELVELAREHAARLLEAAPEDVVLSEEAGVGFHVAGVPARAVSWAEVATDVAGRNQDLTCGDIHDVGEANSFPSGCHIAVVEVDVETGETTLRNFVAVDDVGVRVNPMIVEGQVHGGIASGIGQVLGERMTFDEDGNPLTSTFLDYLLPTADLLPQFETHETVTPSSFNVLGAKGVGEASIIGAVPAMHNAIVDAVSHLGVRHIDLPCTPERIWQAIQS